MAPRRYYHAPGMVDHSAVAKFLLSIWGRPCRTQKAGIGPFRKMTILYQVRERCLMRGSQRG